MLDSGGRPSSGETAEDLRRSVLRLSVSVMDVNWMNCRVHDVGGMDPPPPLRWHVALSVVN